MIGRSVGICAEEDRRRALVRADFESRGKLVNGITTDGAPSCVLTLKVGGNS